MPKISKDKGISQRRRVVVDWNTKFNQLVLFKEENGHCRVPRKHPQLGNWVMNQRIAVFNKKKEGELSSDQIKVLNGIGFEWVLVKHTVRVGWDERFEELKQYKKDHGDYNVPRKYKANPQLASWVNTNRTKYKNGKLSKERIESLQGIGFSWVIGCGRVGWDERFKQLKEYKDTNGNCNVSTYDENNKELAYWVTTQRRFYKKNKLLPERIKLLNEIEFVWELRQLGKKLSPKQKERLEGIGFEAECRKQVGWDERFEQLKGYKKDHGDCNVPQKYNANPKLGKWVDRQRQAYKKGKLSKEHIESLQGIGFSWAGGVSRKNKLSPDQKERLEGIGFELECRKQVGWDGRFEQLKGYKRDHGDCNVSRNYKASPQLGQWVNDQRTAYKKGKLLKERIESLQGIGFSWAGGVSRGRRSAYDGTRMKKSEPVDIQWDDSNNAPTKKFVSTEKSETELKRFMLRLIIPAGGMGLILSTTHNGPVSVMGVDQKSILRHAIPSYLLGRRYCITSIRSSLGNQQFSSSIENRLDIINAIKSCRAMRLDNIEVVFQEQSYASV